MDTAAQEFIISGEGIVEVQEHDDGCIDGRETLELYVTGGGDFYTKPADNSNHERAKVAGGGYITTQAMRLGVGRRGDSIDDDLALVGSDLAEKEIYCGAHSLVHTNTVKELTVERTISLRSFWKTDLRSVTKLPPQPKHS